MRSLKLYASASDWTQEYESTARCGSNQQFAVNWCCWRLNVTPGAVGSDFMGNSIVKN